MILLISEAMRNDMIQLEQNIMHKFNSEQKICWDFSNEDTDNCGFISDELIMPLLEKVGIHNLTELMKSKEQNEIRLIREEATVNVSKECCCIAVLIGLQFNNDVYVLLNDDKVAWMPKQDLGKFVEKWKQVQYEMSKINKGGR